MILNCVIVDDEQSSIDTISNYIELMPTLELIGSFTDSRKALEQMLFSDNIDLLFLDIDMPVVSGIEIAKVLREKTRKIIFITAFSDYAFDAFDAEGDGFLSKPISFGKFAKTVNRLFPEDSNSSYLQIAQKDDYFLVKNTEDKLRIVKVRYDDVIAFESVHNHIKIILNDNTSLIIYRSLQDIRDLTAARSEFKQFHRAYIISTNYIDYIEGNSIAMLNELVITVGDNYKKPFKDYLEGRLVKTTRIR